jgi:predicted GH43/DUF377 family glycosyl hydrolase
MTSSTVFLERCNGGQPIISPTSNWWESGVTFNAAALYLGRSQRNDAIIRTVLPMRSLHDPELADGIVVIHYRARPETDPGLTFVRSFVGLAIFTPALKPLHRYADPVVSPETSGDAFDYLGVEDARITRIEDTFYMVYCGLRADPETIYHAQLCLARSADLLHWEKLGPIPGEINGTRNKDGVLFSERVSNKFYMLHRPWWKGLRHSDYAMRLAVSEAPVGPWRDLGEILHSFENPKFEESWVGGGSVPISIGGDRFVVIYHTGNSHADGRTEYDLDAALFDMSYLQEGAASIVRARIEHLLVPERPAELSSHSSLQVQNVLFTCGTYEFGGYLYIVYGGADTYTLVARVEKNALVTALENADLKNPFLE